ncbi:TPA: hypothetical protein RFT58_001756 [Klebsiella pneumoniae subsp. pneumoniae]|uniref:hypothetical protein n=1 Tax=Klebsiella pneumoniae TaxID=573 RepID=UPI0010342C96|nr:hypothetical protein [Klebsiella pneumoniae]MCI3426643.1 hypothetical protein [Escherichia coli]HDU4554694.1 hypothetical protein [Klebsiella pneumoniae subsp. pneumoniae]ELA2164197.1 hypothetical protein [Klebsiella pneumoniae]MCD9722460.1 hypothetical protein [Klebsiella pneumoniae]MCJ4933267.1 hypothetical protein [Klebsiella pneumoniae]
MSLYSQKKDALSLGFIITLLLVAYSPAIIGNFGFSDDYSTYFVANMSHSDLIKWDVMSGRPLYAALRYFAQGFIESTSDFKIFRIVSVASIISLGMFLYFFLRKSQFPGGLIAWCITPVLLCCLPPVALYGAWSTCFPYVTSIILAGLSYANLNYNHNISAYLRAPLSLLLLALSFAIYQPTGMSFSLFMLIDNCLNDSRISYKKILINVVTIASGMFFSLLFSKAVPLLWYGQTFPRSALATSLNEKAKWFLDKPFHDAVSNYSIFYTSFYFTASLAVLILSFLLICKQKDGLKKAALSIAILIGSFSPNLIIAESWVSYRSLVSLELCIGVVMAFGMASFTNRFNFRSVALSVAAAYAVFSCASFIYTNFVRQYDQESIVLKTAIKDKITKDYTGYLMFDISNPEWNVFSPTKYDEIGAPSIQIAWAISGFADSLRKEMGYNFRISNAATDASVLSTDVKSCSKDCTIIKVTDRLRLIKD